MTHAATLPAVILSRAEATATTRPRLFFVDHLRSTLMILVVLHHVALVYGASLEGYYYVEPPFGDAEAFRTLLIFALVNQAWFMGAFFLVAGYFTPGSVDRKGSVAFLKDRLVRLGIPLALFFFVLGPISCIGYFLMPADLTGITTPLTWGSYWHAYPALLGMGPLWFVAMLLIFSLAYAGWRALAGDRPSSPGDAASSGSQPTAPGYLSVGVFVLVVALASYLTRMLVPLGQAVLQFPTLAYFPQYLSFFVVGMVAYRREWFRTVPDSMGIAGLAAAAVASLILFPLAFSGQWFSLELSPATDNAMGNGHWQSAAYALWDSIFAVGMCLGLGTLFRRFVDRRESVGRFFSQQSYAVYVIQIPVIVFIAYALRDIELDALRKFALVSAVVLPACFAIAFLVRKVPLASRVF
jgi:glucan biosynthesis protein C